MNALAAAIQELARTPVLLVASDFDGTLARIVNDPAAASAEESTLAALQALVQIPRTHVAVISGRGWDDLAARVPVRGVHLIGSHGAEMGGPRPLAPEEGQRLRQIIAEMRRIAAAAPGVHVEEKPASAALHYRNAEPAVGTQAESALMAGAGRWPGVHARHGKKVIELSVFRADKGTALQTLRQKLGASAVLFAGDDLTDEDVFASLKPPDVAIKVGPGESRAGCRVPDIAALAGVLRELAKSRGEQAGVNASKPVTLRVASVRSNRLES